MIETSDRRRVARLFVPRSLGSMELRLRQVNLLDLSLAGARIEHEEQLREGLECVVDLPRVFGRLRLTGEVVWTRPQGGEQTCEGDTPTYYQSGLVFVGITPEQQRALAAGLETLKTTNGPPG